MTYKHKTPQKREKVQNKMSFFRVHPPVFLPKRSKRGLFLLSVRICAGGKGWLAIDGEQLTKVYEITFLWATDGLMAFGQWPPSRGSVQSGRLGIWVKRVFNPILLQNLAGISRKI
jgi:hypothetical protein